MQYKQKNDEGFVAFGATIRSLAKDADATRMTTDQLICALYVAGVKDDELRANMSKIANPTLEQFNIMLAEQDAAAEINKASRPNASAFAMQKGKRPGGPARSVLSEDEKKRRKAIKGKCFRCGQSDHMMPSCKLSPNIICNTCKQQGHVNAVCGKNVNARSVQQSSGSGSNPAPMSAQQIHQLQMQQLTQQQQTPTGLPAIEYKQQDGAQSFYLGHPIQEMARVESAEGYNVPTPEVPL